MRALWLAYCVLLQGFIFQPVQLLFLPSPCVGLGIWRHLQSQSFAPEGLQGKRSPHIPRKSPKPYSRTEHASTRFNVSMLEPASRFQAAPGLQPCAATPGPVGHRVGVWSDVLLSSFVLAAVSSSSQDVACCRGSTRACARALRCSALSVCFFSSTRKGPYYRSTWASFQGAGSGSVAHWWLGG